MNDVKVVTDEELQRQLNDYQEFIATFIDGFTTDLFRDGIIDEIQMEDLKRYFANPDDNNQILTDLAEYFYITTGEIHIMFELIEALPTLNYKINVFEKPENHEIYASQIRRTMHRIKHKPLTRDILKQTAAAGTLTGIWLGNKSNLYPYIFDDPTKVFPAYRKNGDWVLLFDLSLLNNYSEFYRGIVFDNLAPYITKQHFEKYQKSNADSDRYVQLPQDRTFVVHTHKLRRNQGLGTGWANSAMFDVLHKRKIKNVERAIANKIINSIAILTIGNEKDPQHFGNTNLNPRLKRKVFNGVREALARSAQSGDIPVVAIPEFAKLEFPDVKADGLDGKKFEHINMDIQSGLGVSGALAHGEGGNHASARINLDFFYRRIAVLLEQIDTDMYQKMINLILPKKEKDNYYITYDKGQPLTTKEVIDILMKLNDKGWSVKAIIDELPNADWDSYLEQTLYETMELELQDKLRPYVTSHTISNKDSGANTVSDDDISDEGASTRDSGKNEI